MSTMVTIVSQSMLANEVACTQCWDAHCYETQAIRITAPQGTVRISTADGWSYLARDGEHVELTCQMGKICVDQQEGCLQGWQLSSPFDLIPARDTLPARETMQPVHLVDSAWNTVRSAVRIMNFYPLPLSPRSRDQFTGIIWTDMNDLYGYLFPPDRDAKPKSSIAATITSQEKSMWSIWEVRTPDYYCFDTREIFQGETIYDSVTPLLDRKCINITKPSMIPINTARHPGRYLFESKPPVEALHLVPVEPCLNSCSGNGACVHNYVSPTHSYAFCSCRFGFRGRDCSREAEQKTNLLWVPGTNICLIFSAVLMYLKFHQPSCAVKNRSFLKWLTALCVTCAVTSSLYHICDTHGICYTPWGGLQHFVDPLKDSSNVDILKLYTDQRGNYTPDQVDFSPSPGWIPSGDAPTIDIGITDRITTYIPPPLSERYRFLPQVFRTNFAPEFLDSFHWLSRMDHIFATAFAITTGLTLLNPATTGNNLMAWIILPLLCSTFYVILADYLQVSMYVSGVVAFCIIFVIAVWWYYLRHKSVRITIPVWLIAYMGVAAVISSLAWVKGARSIHSYWLMHSLWHVLMEPIPGLLVYFHDAPDGFLNAVCAEPPTSNREVKGFEEVKTRPTTSDV